MRADEVKDRPSCAAHEAVIWSKSISACRRLNSIFTFASASSCIPSLSVLGASPTTLKSYFIMRCAMAILASLMAKKRPGHACWP